MFCGFVGLDTGKPLRGWTLVQGRMHSVRHMGATTTTTGAKPSCRGRELRVVHAVRAEWSCYAVMCPGGGGIGWAQFWGWFINLGSTYSSWIRQSMHRSILGLHCFCFTVQYALLAKCTHSTHVDCKYVFRKGVIMQFGMGVHPWSADFA